jgi:co-chaperonin GroES (HSP10)
VNPLLVRPRRDWVLVQCEPRKEVLDSGLVLPQMETGVEKVMERAGKVLRIGPGDRASVIGVKEGDRVLFRGFLKHAQPIESDDGSDCFLMDINDVMSVVDVGIEVGAFSGRPMVPEVR